MSGCPRSSPSTSFLNPILENPKLHTSDPNPSTPNHKPQNPTKQTLLQALEDEYDKSKAELLHQRNLSIQAQV